MELICIFSIIIAACSVLFSFLVIRRAKRQIAEMSEILADVKNGNGNRRILAATNELVAPLAYEINEIKEGYYVLITFSAEKTCVKELDRVMRIKENILRHMIISKGE